MRRRSTPILTCLALLGTLACQPAVQDEQAARAAGSTAYEEAKEAAENAYKAAASFDEKLAIARGFLAQYPDTEDTTDVLRLIGGDALEAERPEAVFELLSRTLERIEDLDSRFQVRLQLADLYARAGRKDELRALAAELTGQRELTYRDHFAIAEAAVTAEDWTLAIEHSDASLALATPEHFKQDSPEVSDADAQVYGTRRAAHSLANKGWAQYHLGRTEEAFATFCQAEESTDYNLLGVDSTALHGYWGRALADQGRPEKAMELLAAEAVFGSRPEGLEAYREAYASYSGGEDGFEDHLWELRLSQARPVPEFALPNYAGETVRLSDFAGDVVLLAFWFPT